MFRMGRARRTLAIILVLLALSVASFIFWLYQLDCRKSKALKQSVSAMAADLQTRDRHRPVLHGRTDEGNAWLEYRRALSEISKIKNPVGKRFDLLRLKNAGQHGLRYSFVDMHRDVLDCLRRGARRETA